MLAQVACQDLRPPGRAIPPCSRPTAVGVRQEDSIKFRLDGLLDHHLRNPLAHGGHSAGELHFCPTNIWNRVRSLTRSTRTAWIFTNSTFQPPAATPNLHRYRANVGRRRFGIACIVIGRTCN